MLNPNAAACLVHVGVDPADFGRVFEAFELRTRTGASMGRVGVHEGSGHSYTTHRGDLHRALQAGLSSVELRLGATVRMEDGGLRLSTGERLQADHLVCAEGIGSSLREGLAPGIRPASLTPPRRVPPTRAWTRQGDLRL